MDKELRILILEDVPNDAELMELELREAGIAFSSKRVETQKAFLKALKDFLPDLILGDYNLPSFDGLAALAIVQEECPDVPFIFVSGTIGEDYAIETSKKGATDYVLKNRMSRLAPAVHRALEEIKERAERKQAEAALWESEDRYRDLVENSQDLICTHDLQGQFLSVNPAVAKLLGYDRSTILKMNVRDILAPDVRDQFSSYLDTIRRDGIAKGSMLVQTATGERRLLEYNNTLRTEGVASPIVRSINHDVTEPKRAEQALRESEEKYRILVETSPDAITLFDLNLNIIMVNGPALTLYGCERSEEIIGKSVLDFLVPEQLARAREDIEKVLETGSIGTVEYTLLKKDGTLFPVELKASLILDKKKKPGAILCVSRDITERKQAEETLRSEQEKLEMVTQNIGAGLALISKDYHTLWANSVLKQIFGDVESKNCYSTYNQRAGICPGCGVRGVFEGSSEKVTHEQVGRDNQGNTIWSEIIATPIKDKDGNITAALELVIPITERKRVEQEKAALEEQFRQSQKMEAIGRLAGGISHDFNNLLTIIKGYSQLFRLGLKESDPLRENIEQITKATDRASGLIRQLLAFSRRQILEMKVLDLNTVLWDLEKMLRRVIGEDIELVTFFADDLGRVKTDPGQIEQVVMNLAVNARDAMPNGGRLTIETANVDLDDAYAHSHIDVTPGRYVMLSVSDNGVGMSPEVKERVFEPFFTTKEKGKGTGLGLSTVYGIVKQSEGNIWVYSEPGKGTSFKIYLPRVEEAFEEIDEKVVNEELLHGSETILVVEDEEGVRQLAADILENQGYKVLQAHDEGDALRICEQNRDPIPLMLTDVVMPKINGRALYERLTPLHPEMKVLYMSGYTGNAIVHHGVLEPGINYIQKPFSMEGLARKVRQVLDKDSRPAV